MAKVSQIGLPAANLTSILNVSQRVGPKSRPCPNLQDDVDLVEKLILLIDSSPMDGMNVSNNGIYDGMTGYCIYNIQWLLKNKYHKSSIVIDGVVSPATGAGYGGNSVYTIVQLNGMAKTQNPSGYDKLRETFKCTG